MKTKYIICFVIMLRLYGCSNKEMTRDEVIAAVKECREANMKPVIIYRLNYSIIKVNYVPKEEQ